MEWILLILILVADQISKYVIAANAAHFANLEIIPGFFYLTYVKNTGAAWSMLAGKRVLLSLIAATAIAGMLWFLQKARKERNYLTMYALVLMIAGAAGNLIDRLMLGYVRDFLHFFPFGYDFPVFNVADMSLCIGVGLLILSTVLEKDEPEGTSEKQKRPEFSEKVMEPEKNRTGGE